MTMQIIHKNNNYMYCISRLQLHLEWTKMVISLRCIYMQIENLLPTSILLHEVLQIRSCDKLLTMSTVVNMMAPTCIYKTCDSIFKHAKHSACLEGIYDASKGMVSQLKVCKLIMYIFFMINCWKLLRVYSTVKLSLNETQQHALLLISQSARWHWINTQNLIQLQKFNRNTYK